MTLPTEHQRTLAAKIIADHIKKCNPKLSTEALELFKKGVSNGIRRESPCFCFGIYNAEHELIREGQKVILAGIKDIRARNKVANTRFEGKLEIKFNNDESIGVRLNDKPWKDKR